MVTTAAIPPGGEGEIQVTFATSGKKGRQSKPITVTSNDPANPTAVLKVGAFIAVDFDFETPTLYVGKIGRNKDFTSSAFLLVSDPQTRVEDLASSSPFVTARIAGSPEPAGEFLRLRVEVMVKSGMAAGPIDATITVKSNLATSPRASLRVTGTAVGDVEAEPDRLLFAYTGTGGPAGKPGCTTTITSHLQGKPLEILDVRDPGGNLDLTLKPLVEGQKYELTAKLKTKEVPSGGGLTGNVVVTTNYPEQRELIIGYTVVNKVGSRKEPGIPGAPPKK